jgi:hypothetical protein
VLDEAKGRSLLRPFSSAEIDKNEPLIDQERRQFLPDFYLWLRGGIDLRFVDGNESRYQNAEVENA